MLGRLVVLGAFLVGAAAFFLPFFHVQAQVTTGGAVSTQAMSFSVLQIFQGADAFEDLAGGARMSEAQRRQIDTTLSTIRGVLLIPFAPTALFLLFTLFGIKRFGRGLGIASLIVGLIAVGGWALITAAAAETRSTEASFGIGLTLVLVGGILGFVGGLAATIRPEPVKA